MQNHIEKYRYIDPDPILPDGDSYFDWSTGDFWTEWDSGYKDTFLASMTPWLSISERYTNFLLITEQIDHSDERCKD